MAIEYLTKLDGRMLAPAKSMTVIKTIITDDNVARLDIWATEYHRPA